ncbi:MAG: HesA/MoeB/ThiF family protein [Gammaproteobacteria bacterium]|nr:HesA/MoeB/ThiF family protein [Gammaproteobacteria bacterium]
MNDLTRYARQIVLPQVGVNGQHLLYDSTALVIGCGGLGCAAAPYLVGAGIGRLLLVDRDRIELSNLQRQVLFRTADLGREKAVAAAAALRALNPDSRIEAHAGGLEPARLTQWVADADVVLDCSDNFPTRHAVNAACVAAKTPLVSGAALRLEGQLAVFDLRRGPPCYACLFGAEGPAAERCEESGVLGPLVGVVGALQALAALQLLLGLSAGAGTLVTWDAAAGAWRRLSITADPRCPVCAAGNAR